MYVVDENGKFATRRPVRIGRQNPQYYEVTEGLKPGERVIISGYRTIWRQRTLIFELNLWTISHKFDRATASGARFPYSTYSGYRSASEHRCSSFYMCGRNCSYDSFHNGARVYRAESRLYEGDVLTDNWATTTYGHAPVMKREIPGIETYVRITAQDRDTGGRLLRKAVYRRGLLLHRAGFLRGV